MVSPERPNRFIISAMLFHCPQCQQQIYESLHDLPPDLFHAAVDYMFCPHCRCMAARHDHGWTVAGVVPEFPADCPAEIDLTVADRGTILGRPFCVNYHILTEIQHHDGLQKYVHGWSVVQPNNQIAYLSVQNQRLSYSASTHRVIFDVPPFESLSIGDVINIDGHIITIDKIYTATVITANGFIGQGSEIGDALRVAYGRAAHYLVEIEYWSQNRVDIGFGIEVPLDVLKLHRDRR